MALGKRLISTGVADAACTTDSVDPFGDSSGVALYSLDYDASEAGGNYDGTPTDVEFGVGGQINYGAGFNGSSSRIPIPRIDSLTADVTVSGWLNLGNTTTSNRIRFIEINTNANGYAGTLSIYYKPSNGEWQARSGNGTSSNSNVLTHIYTLAQSTWYHVCFTRDDSTNVTKFYVNGALKDTETVSVSSSYPSGATGVIGDLNYSAGLNYNWLGEMDQVRIFNRALDETTDGEISALYAEQACVYTCTTDDVNYPFSDGTNVEAYYKLDNSSEDYVGGNDGSDTNIEYRFGRFGQAAVFNGSSSYIDLNSAVLPASVFSVSFWVNVNSLVNEWIFSQYTGGVTGRFIFNITSTGGFQINVSSTNSLSTTNIPAITIGNWHQVVVVKDGSNGWTLYSDGSLHSTWNSSENIITNQNTILGGDDSVTSNNLDGSIDQVRIYSTALTDSQVTELYNEKPCADTSNFKTVLWNMDGVNGRYISNVGFDLDVDDGGDGGLVWIKDRDDSSIHVLFDTIRGATNYLSSSSAAAEASASTTLQSFEANGFTLGNSGAVNDSSGNGAVAWTWKAGGDAVQNNDGVTSGSVTAVTSTVSANTSAGFSICKFTSPSSGFASWGHGLTSAPPELIILKATGLTQNWIVYAPSILGQRDGYLTSAAFSATYSPDIISVDSDKIDLGRSGYGLSGSSDYISYCFHSVTGYSKIGTYTGDTSSTNTINVGFAPRFLMIKRTDSTGNWRMYDRERDSGNLPQRIDHNLAANLSGAEYDATSGSTGYAWFSSTGFYFETNQSNPDLNANLGTYIYMAFK